MSVHTEADKQVEEVRAAIKALQVATANAFKAICVDECWGADNYTDEFKQTLSKLQGDVFELRSRF